MKILASVSVSYKVIRATASLARSLVVKAVSVIDAPRIRVTAYQYVLPIVTAAAVSALVMSTSYTSPLAAVQPGTMKATIVPAIQLQDDVFAVDNLAKDISRVSFDNATITDALLAAFGKVLAESAAASDALTVNMSKVLSDSAASSDALAITFGKVLADSATASDALVNDVGKVAADSVTPTDASVYNVGKVLADSATITDAIVFDLQHVLADSVTITDALGLAYSGIAGRVLDGAAFNKRPFG